MHAYPCTRAGRGLAPTHKPTRASFCLQASLHERERTTTTETRELRGGLPPAKKRPERSPLLRIKVIHCRCGADLFRDDRCCLTFFVSCFVAWAACFAAFFSNSVIFIASLILSVSIYHFRRVPPNLSPSAASTQPSLTRKSLRRKISLKHSRELIRLDPLDHTATCLG